MPRLEIGALIKQRRIERGMSLQSLGKRCGVSDTEILKIERGERQSPSCQALHRIAKELGFHPLELFKVSKVQSYVDFLNSDKEKQEGIRE